MVDLAQTGRQMRVERREATRIVFSIIESKRLPVMNGVKLEILARTLSCYRPRRRFRHSASWYHLVGS
jgi:hypothetical protein